MSKPPAQDILSPDHNRPPVSVHRIHLMGICGTGMASLAGMLHHLGYDVTGSDEMTYPPMSDFLAALGIPVSEGYRAENLHPPPDLVVVGNVITRRNPEAIEMGRLGLPYLSFPQALKQYAFQDKHCIVISGTHGKTTTSALTAWILDRADLSPGFMIGGIPVDLGTNFRLGSGRYFVIEGDEYDTAFFDKRPKFVHYDPQTVILTSIEFDHADIYRDLDQVRSVFRKLIALIPPEGRLIANGADPVIRAELSAARCPVTFYGPARDALWQATRVRSTRDTTRVTARRGDGPSVTLTTRLYGRHNISNLIAAVACTRSLGIDMECIREAVRQFQGVKRRQEPLGYKKGILILDDFAHHPTSVKETVAAVKEKFPRNRLIAVFEPRSNTSRRNVFQHRYSESFEAADIIMVPEPAMMDTVPPTERFSSLRLVQDIREKGAEAFYFPTTDRLLEALLERSRPGDVVLFMSNGAFDHLPRRMLEALDGPGSHLRPSSKPPP